MNFVQNILWNSIEGFVEAGTRTAGGYAGDTLIKAGDLIENGGRGVGGKIERTASNYGTKITGQSYQPATTALPSTARKPALKRSNSSPAAPSKAMGPGSKTPIGAKKNTGGVAAKQITSGSGGAQKAIGGVAKSVGGAQKAIGGATTAAKKELPKPFPNNQPYGISVTPSSVTSKQKSLNNNNNNNSSLNKSSPHPTEKKTAVKPGQSKPFNAANKDTIKEGAGDKEKGPYPGTTSYPGQGSKTPVKKYKPLPRLQAPAEKGKVQHIGVA